MELVLRNGKYTVNGKTWDQLNLDEKKIFNQAIILKKAQIRAIPRLIMKILCLDT